MAGDGVAHLFVEDPSLIAGLPAEEAAAARELAVVPVEVAQLGAWRSPSGERAVGLAGLLVLDGLLARNVRIEAVRFTELVGRGDLLRPWQPFTRDGGLAGEMRWEVLEEARLAQVSTDLLGELAGWPAIFDALLGRAIERVRSLAFHLGVCHLTRVDLRVLLALWHFADRWGTGEADGVMLRLPLDNALIARVVGVQRASATTALTALERRGFLHRRPDGWLLAGDPPEQLHELRCQAGG